MARRASHRIFIFLAPEFSHARASRRCVEDVGNWAMANIKRVGAHCRIAAVTADALALHVIVCAVCIC